LTDSSFASGNTTDGKLKKIYIGPIAPQSFAAPSSASDDEEMESVLSDSDNPYDAPLSNTPFNSVPPLSTMKAANSSTSSSSSNFLRKTDRIPKSWKDELRALITDTIDGLFEERGLVSSHNRKRKNTYSFDDDDDLELIATAPKHRKRLGKVEALGKGHESTYEKSGNDSVSDVNLWPPHAERTRFQLSPSSIRFEQGSWSLFSFSNTYR